MAAIASMDHTLATIEPKISPRDTAGYQPQAKPHTADRIARRQARASAQGASPPPPPPPPDPEVPAGAGIGWGDGLPRRLPDEIRSQQRAVRRFVGLRTRVEDERDRRLLREVREKERVSSPPPFNRAT